MARNRFQSWLLRTRIKCDILFDPEKLEVDKECQEPKESINARFSKLPASQKAAFRAQFTAHQPLPFFPLHIYRLSNPGREDGGRKYGFHWEYDRPERRLEMKRLALAGFDLTRLDDLYYTFAQLRELRRAQEQGLDMEPLLDNRYNRFQLMVLTKIMRDGCDISELADPDLPAREMAAAYAEQVEDRMVEAAQKKNMDRLLDAAAELDERFLSESVDISSLDARLKGAQQRSKFEISESKSKVLDFPVGSRHGPER